MVAAVVLLAACQMSHVPSSAQPETAPPGVEPDESNDSKEMGDAAPVGVADETPGEMPEPGHGAPGDGTATLSIASASAAESDGTVFLAVSLRAAGAHPVTVSYATEDATATAGQDYRHARGTLTFAPGSVAVRHIEVTLIDDRIREDAETLVVRLSGPRGAALAVAAASATILDDDRPALIVEPRALNVLEGATGSYSVVLASQPTGPVTVTPVVSSAALTATPAALRFTAADWRVPQMVTVSAAEDQDAAAAATMQVAHTARGGGYDAAAAAVVAVTVVEDDVSTLAIADARGAEASGRMGFAVISSLAGADVVTVDYATGAAGDTAVEGQDYTPHSGTLRFPARSTETQTIEVTVRDDTLHEDDEQFTVTLANPVGAVLAGGGATVAATGRIEDDDVPPRVSIADAESAESAGSMRFVVTLDRAGGSTVTVDYATAEGTAREHSDFVPAAGTLTFAAGATSRTLAVAIPEDQRDEEDHETFTVTLSAAVNATVAAAGRTATGTIADNDPLPELTIADASIVEDSGNRTLRFEVRLDSPSGRTVTVDYETVEGTAREGTDYRPASGTLTLRGGSETGVIPVPIPGDRVAEDRETFGVTLSNPRRARLADADATGTITDDDERGVRVDPVGLRLYEGSTGDSYTVVLTSQPTAAVAVDVAVPAGAQVTAQPTRLSFGSDDWETARTVTVTALQEASIPQTITIEHTVSGGDYAHEAAASVTVSIEELPALELDSLAVSRGTLHPAFDAGIYHYALACSGSAALRVTATAKRRRASVTLLRDDPDDNHTATGSLDVSVNVHHDHDIAVELSDAGDSVTYVVHCLPENYPTIQVVHKTDAVSGGFLFATPQYYGGVGGHFHAVMDNNGVTRFHQSQGFRLNFRPLGDGPLIDGKRVRYISQALDSVYLLDADFEVIREVSTVDPVRDTDAHDFQFTSDGSSTHFLFIAYERATRDGKTWYDSIIQEVSQTGTEVFRWNSWDHLNVDDDCHPTAAEYAHLNSLQVVDGDIIASFARCNQVLRIDRGSSPPGKVVWQLGGSSPPEDSGIEYLEIAGDPAGGFCGQHQVTLTDNQTILLFDNRAGCPGAHRTRAVEYDISSATQARYLRQYERPATQMNSETHGGVTLLENGNWLIAWGGTGGTLAVSEVASDGTAVFRMRMFRPGNSSAPGLTYRVYRASEADVRIPLNLP